MATRTSQDVIEANLLPSTANVRTSQDVIEVNVLPTTAAIRLSQGVIELILGPPLPPSLACPLIASGQVGVPFSAQLIATNGVPPYSFAIIGGSLPPGLTLNSTTGVISGTPTTAGTFPYTAQVTDSSSPVQTAQVSCSITITPIALACPVTNIGVVGVFFTSTLVFSGGVPPLMFAIIGGALPPGLTLNSLTGVISGTPTVEGSYSYTARVSDSSSPVLSVQVQCVIIIGCPQFELRRVYAMMRPHTRLPVRGS